MEGCEEQIQHSLRHVNKTKQSGVQSPRNELRQTVESKLWRDKTKGGKCGETGYVKRRLTGQFAKCDMVT